MKKSIYRKIFFPFLILFILLSGFIYVYNYQQIYKQNKQLLSHELDEKIYILKPSIVRYITDSTYTQLDSFIKAVGRDIDSRLTIIRADGLVVGESDDQPEKMVNHLDRPEIREAFEKGHGSAVRYSNTVKSEMLYVAQTVEYNGKIIGFIRIASYLSWINQFVHDARLNFLLVILAGLLFAAGAGYILSHQIMTPVSKLASFSSRLFETNFRERLELNTGDEIEDLAHSLNHMAEEMQNLLATIRNEKEELAVIIDNLQDGLIVLNTQGKIILANTSFKKMFGISEVKNRYFWEIIRKIEFRKYIDNINLPHNQEPFFLEVNNRYFEVSVSRLLGTGELVVLFHDRTDAHQLEITKRDFVANVSHELRTPLTAIMGFIETIEEEPSETERFLVIIKRNTRRLINLVEDLQVLSRLEDKEVKIEKRVFDLRQTIEHSSRIFTKKVSEKNLILDLQLPDYPLTINGDAAKIEQLVINLLDNAIRYTDAGEVAVHCDIIGNYVQLTVKDTGIGIPEKFKERIFERFYTVNEARSRVSGGTGLGLSIVKHIAKLHNASIDVQSEIGVGSTFIVRFEAASEQV